MYELVPCMCGTGRRDEALSLPPCHQWCAGPGLNAGSWGQQACSSKQLPTGLALLVHNRLKVCTNYPTQSSCGRPWRHAPDSSVDWPAGPGRANEPPEADEVVLKLLTQPHVDTSRRCGIESSHTLQVRRCMLWRVDCKLSSSGAPVPTPRGKGWVQAHWVRVRGACGLCRLRAAGSSWSALAAPGLVGNLLQLRKRASQTIMLDHEHAVSRRCCRGCWLECMVAKLLHKQRKLCNKQASGLRVLLESREKTT